jgi:hypothetical protein
MDTLNAIVLLPKLKGWFFGKSPFEALFTRIYLFAYIIVFAMAALLALAVWAAKKFVLKKASGGRAGRSGRGGE